MQFALRKALSSILLVTGGVLMNTNEAIRTMVEESGYSHRALSVELGHSATWLSSTLHRPGDSECGTVAAIARIAGYSLVLVPRNRPLPVGSLVIDPPSDNA